MSAVVPRKFLPNQVRFSLAKGGQLVAQLVRLRSPWDQAGEVVETATAAGPQQHKSAGQDTAGKAHQQSATPIPPGQMHPTTKAQLDKLSRPFVLLAELEACRRAGSVLCSALSNKGLQGQEPLVVGAELPHPLAHDQRLQAVLRAMESRGIRVARSVLKAKVLKHQ